MRPLSALLAVSVLFVVAAYAQSPCTTTKTITRTFTTPDTTNKQKSTTVTETYFEATSYIYATTTSTSITTSYVDIVSTSYSIMTESTRTLGAYKFNTKSCPPGPSYAIACPKFSATETEYHDTTIFKGVVTSTYTNTIYAQVTLTATVVKSTITTGNPPTTKTVKSTSTQVTTTTTSTVTVFSYVKTSTRHFGDEVTNTTTVTTSLASPTATATLNLFSLQITNTSNPIDGYTWGQKGADVVVQNASTWRYYIDPGSQFLVHAPSGNYLAYSICDGEECYYPFTFLPDKPLPADDGNPATRRLKCSIGCGQLLQCWTEDESVGKVYVALIVFDNVLGAQIGITPFGEGGPAVPVNLMAVGPTRGR